MYFCFCTNDENITVKQFVFSQTTHVPLTCLGFDIDQLREQSTSKFWQSDDATPHYINVQFKRKMLISDLCIYMDYKNDESYTPNK